MVSILKEKLKEKCKFLVKKIKDIYMIKISNAIIVILGTILLYFLIILLQDFIPNAFNIHLGIVDGIDYLTIYSIIASLLIPLVILMAEKINKRRDYIVVLTYLKTTGLFPILIYFCTNIGIFTIKDDKYYFIISCVLSVLLVLFIYYRSLHLLSDLKYEEKKLKDIRTNIVNQDLDNQFKIYFENNNIKNYERMGIFLRKNSFGMFKEYYSKLITYHNSNKIIKGYNYELLDKIAKSLFDINENYYDDDKTNIHDLKVAVSILSVGDSVKKNEAMIYVYYQKKYDGKIDNITRLLSERLYSLYENENHYYLLKNYSYMHEECINSINSLSVSLLKEKLNNCADIYKEYIDGLKLKYADFKSNGKETNLFEMTSGEIFDTIEQNIKDCAKIISRKDDSYLMLELINFLTDLLFYAYNKGVLLAIPHLFNNYYYIVIEAQSIKDSLATETLIPYSISFMSVIKFGINLENCKETKIILLACNKTMGRMLYQYRTTKYFWNILEKVDNFIKHIDLNVGYLDDNYDENIDMLEVYNELRTHFYCNLFAILAYVVKSFRRNNKVVDKILKRYKDYDIEQIAKIMLDSFANANYYSWDDLTMDGTELICESTIRKNLIHFYCLILNKKENVEFNCNDRTIWYNLNVYRYDIIDELKKLRNDTLSAKFNNIFDNIKRK